MSSRVAGGVALEFVGGEVGREGLVGAEGEDDQIGIVDGELGAQHRVVGTGEMGELAAGHTEIGEDGASRTVEGGEGGDGDDAAVEGGDRCRGGPPVAVHRPAGGPDRRGVERPAFLPCADAQPHRAAAGLEDRADDHPVEIGFGRVGNQAQSLAGAPCGLGEARKAERRAAVAAGGAEGRIDPPAAALRGGDAPGQITLPGPAGGKHAASPEAVARLQPAAPGVADEIAGTVAVADLEDVERRPALAALGGEPRQEGREALGIAQARAGSGVADRGRGGDGQGAKHGEHQPVDPDLLWRPEAAWRLASARRASTTDLRIRSERPRIAIT